MKVKLVDEGSFISTKSKDECIDAEMPPILDDSEEEIYFRIATSIVRTVFER